MDQKLGVKCHLVPARPSAAAVESRRFRWIYTVVLGRTASPSIHVLRGATDISAAHAVLSRPR